MKFKKPRSKKRLHLINEDINAPEVRLIDENKQQVGIVPIRKALAIAAEKELDLVAISPKAQPPVCRILDYGKFLYALQKKAHEAQKMQRKIHVKEIKFTPVIGDHDVDVKLKKIKQFLEDGNKVKVTIWLRGRQKRRPELLSSMTDRIMSILTEIAEIEAPPKREKWSTHILIGKKKEKEKEEKEDKEKDTTQEITDTGKNEEVDVDVNEDEVNDLDYENEDEDVDVDEEDDESEDEDDEDEDEENLKE